MLGVRVARSLWSGGRGDGLTPEPSETRFRGVVLALLLILGPPILLTLYHITMFPGLFSTEAVDYAQLGRNLASGRGFVTYVVRPLGIGAEMNPYHVPETVHGPLYPLALAFFIGALGAKDSVVSLVSGVFFLLTIPVLYSFGKKVFSHGIGLLTAAIYSVNAVMLEYAASGLQITLYIFLTTSLLLVMYNWMSKVPPPEINIAPPFPRAQFVLTGVVTGLLYLTDSIFVWVFPPVLLSVIWFSGRYRRRAIPMVIIPLAILVLPWMLRNYNITGNPIFGLRGSEIWMNTHDYPLLTGYRMVSADVIQGVPLFKGVVQKILLGAGIVIQSFPQITASWVLAFFLPCLLFPFADRAANTVRRAMMWCFAGMLMGMLAFKVDMPLFVSLIPAMLIFSVAFLIHLMNQARLSRMSRGFAIALLTMAVVYPLVSEMTIVDRPGLEMIRASRVAREMGKQGMMARDEVALSDQPWAVAWYADRPAIWMPAVENRIAEMRQQFPQTRWLFLTSEVRGFSSYWQLLYDQILQVVQARAEQIKAMKRRIRAEAIAGTTVRWPQDVPVQITAKDMPIPLLQALEGYTTITPPGAVGEDEYSQPAILARIPRDNQPTRRSANTMSQ